MYWNTCKIRANYVKHACFIRAPNPTRTRGVNTRTRGVKTRTKTRTKSVFLGISDILDFLTFFDDIIIYFGGTFGFSLPWVEILTLLSNLSSNVLDIAAQHLQGHWAGSGLGVLGLTMANRELKSRQWSCSELGDANDRMLKVKREAEDKEELQRKIQEGWPMMILCLSNILAWWQFDTIYIWF